MKTYIKLAITFTLLILIGTGCKDKDRDINISKATLQEILETKFPIEKKSKLFSFSLFDPFLTLEENRFGINLSFKYNALGAVNSGSMDIFGDIEYNRENSSFFLRNVEIRNLKLDNNKIKKMTSTAISKVLNSFFAVNPIYKLQDQGLKEKLARFLLKEIKIMEDKVLIILDAQSKRKKERS